MIAELAGDIRLVTQIDHKIHIPKNGLPRANYVSEVLSVADLLKLV